MGQVVSARDLACIIFGFILNINVIDFYTFSDQLPVTTTYRPANAGPPYRPREPTLRISHLVSVPVTDVRVNFCSSYSVQPRPYGGEPGEAISMTPKNDSWCADTHSDSPEVRRLAYLVETWQLLSPPLGVRSAVSFTGKGIPSIGRSSNNKGRRTRRNRRRYIVGFTMTFQ